MSSSVWFVVSNAVCLYCRHYLLWHLIRRKKYLDTYHSFIIQIATKFTFSMERASVPWQHKLKTWGSIRIQNAGIMRSSHAGPRPTKHNFLCSTSCIFGPARFVPPSLRVTPRVFGALRGLWERGSPDELARIFVSASRFQTRKYAPFRSRLYST